MRNLRFKFLMILIFITCNIVTAKAQVLLITTEDQQQKIRAHQDKLDYLGIIKAEIENRQRRSRQDTLPTNGRNLISRPKSTERKAKKIAAEKKKGPKKQ